MPAAKLTYRGWGFEVQGLVFVSAGLGFLGVWVGDFLGAGLVGGRAEDFQHICIVSIFAWRGLGRVVSKDITSADNCQKTKPEETLMIRSTARRLGEGRRTSTL